jgi:hypothetical protein
MYFSGLAGLDLLLDVEGNGLDLCWMERMELVGIIGLGMNQNGPLLICRCGSVISGHRLVVHN